MKITPRFDYVAGSFDTDNVIMFCLTSTNHGKVELCIKGKDGSLCSLSVAAIKLYSSDLYADFRATQDDATKLGQEIARRWNEFPHWRDVADEQYPTDKKVLCRMKSNGAIVSGYIYKENGT